MEGIRFPAVPDADAAAILALLFQLEQSQWWPSDELARHQFAQLEVLLAHAARTLPFHRERLRAVEVDPAAGLDAEAWARIPILRRADIQERGDALISRDLPPGHGPSGAVFSSGSTGRPIRAVRSQLWSRLRNAFTLRDHLWHRRDTGAKLAAIRHAKPGDALYPKGASYPAWSGVTAATFRNGPGVSLNVHTDIADQVEWLQRERPDYLITVPSNLLRLAEHCLRAGVRLPGLRGVETVGEVVAPQVRALCREAFGVGLVDIYSAREAGYLALQCPEHEHYHVQSEAVLFEVLDDAGRPCAPGQVGRVVVTPLHNFAMPLLRYEIGDYAELGPPCSCGRGLPVLNRILGRHQNMVRLPSGEQRWPLLHSEQIEALLAIAPIRQYQMAQTSLEAIELRLAMDREPTPDERTALGDWVRERCGGHFAVEVRVLDELPRTAEGKFFDFVSEIP